MGLFNNTDVNEELIEKQYEKLFFEGEKVVQAYKLVRDIIIITNYRLVTIDKQGVTGKKQHVISYPLNKIVKFEVENSPYFDLDSEIIIYFGGIQEPVKFTLSKGTDCFEFVRILSECMFID